MNNGACPVDAKPQCSLNIVLAIAIAMCATLLTSAWHFRLSPNHRVGGVAWNALFQFFGPVFGLALATYLAVLAATGRVRKYF